MGSASACLTVILTGDGQVSAAGKRALLCGFAMQSDTSASNVVFENGSGGTALWKHTMGATTAEGDNCDVVVFPIPIEFNNDIYLNLSNTPQVSVSYILMDIS